MKFKVDDKLESSLSFLIQCLRDILSFLRKVQLSIIIYRTIVPRYNIDVNSYYFLKSCIIIYEIYNSVIYSLKGQLNTSLNVSRLSATYLQSKHRNDNYDKQAAEDRLQRLKQEMENKSTIIKNIKLELERLDITE